MNGFNSVRIKHGRHSTYGAAYGVDALDPRTAGGGALQIGLSNHAQPRLNVAAVPRFQEGCHS
ncbi:hypothetical protein AU252_05755 [Pseudarthrobacter sulfonivorans]|uniref:Uncharacterized protein n=1 Tax=Pseudarthrobacter sulfonivorans TaxID=121292 RepID=A0A0U3QGT0_9MICC|nr:hypothetical protein [Pseudarthrobacter sulfonivorans]ALV40731.1 hypothetical protein AU252_05755 [Pseudarthrobacter sulfonivorans]